MSKLLIISSQVHETLSNQQLSLCLDLVKQSSHDYQVEILNAGSYELPFVINHYHHRQPFDGYIALGLILNTSPEHTQQIQSHIQFAFTHFALNQIIVGNGIITGNSVDELSEKINSPDACLSAYPSAFRAVDTLIKLKQRI